MSIKNPVTPSGFETATLGFVAQFIRHYATVCPPVVCIVALIFKGIIILDNCRAVFQKYPFEHVKARFSFVVY
jgi:hypothetical protein